VDSISKTTARIFSRNLPDSSSFERSSSNCLSSEGEGESAPPDMVRVVENERPGAFR
jgi:hypothetical protein